MKQPARTSICVFASSSNYVAPHFFEAAAELGRLIAERSYRLVYGGGGLGLMGEIARSVQSRGGQVVSVTPKYLKIPGVYYEEADEVIVTETLRERQAVMQKLASAFIALPGGFGTLEELLEIIALKQLRVHNMPVVLLNTHGFYDALSLVFEQIYKLRFAKSEYRNYYFLAKSPEEALAHIESYSPQPEPAGGKWF